MPAPTDRTEEVVAPRNGETLRRSQYSYSNLFKVDSLLDLELLHFEGDAHVSSRTCSDSEILHREGHWRANGHANGDSAERPSDVQSDMTMKRKRVQVEADAGRNSVGRDDSDSNDEEEDDSIFAVSDEIYREILSKHYLKFKRAKLHDAMAARSSVAAMRRMNSTKQRSINSDMDPSVSTTRTPGLLKQYSRKTRVKTEHDSNSRKGRCPGAVAAENTSPDASVEYVSVEGRRLDLLEVGGGVQFLVPPFYDRLAYSLRLPDLSELLISERVLNGSLTSTSLQPTMASDPKVKVWRLRTGMGEKYAGDVQKNLQEDGRRTYPLQVAKSAHVQASSDFTQNAVRAHEGFQQSGPVNLRHLSSDGVVISPAVRVIEKGDGYEIIQRRIERKESKRDPALVAREDADKISKHWANLVRKDISKHHKNFMSYHRRLVTDMKRSAEFCQREVKMRHVRSLKVMRTAPMRMRRLARDMVIFWKRVDKEQAEVRRKEERDAADALKRQEELREARRQQQRLNFLLTQTELYSHFMQNKLNGSISAVMGSNALPTALETASSTTSDTKLSEEDAAEEAGLKEEALRAATQAALQARNRTDAFDDESSRLRQAAALEDEGLDGLAVEGTSDINLLNPSTMPTTSSVRQPKLFQGILKEYQLKGLQWLVNCYEQGLNGILADEMGLGKTIQAMAFLGHLAEEKNIWGPFLVVAPASVLNNWADEVSRFCPDLKILPYWGGLSERAVLRKNINPKRLYKRDAGFHVLITSYQLLVSDEKYFRRVKWQYMVLDEAQAIKSSSSLRWKTLLSFNCRNRLLLTGTPIQNSMAELWALLHFIMPTLFDSHEQFSEWFSKGIEGHAEHGGTLNEHQLTRLHAILKPFMLRRVKKDVITEMTSKKEIVVPCSLSSRQQAFYKAIKNKISVADLFDSKGALSDKKVLNLMNIVIQLRKVCNHPELFERNEGSSFLHFASIRNSLQPPTFGELEEIHYAGSCNPVVYQIPKILYRDGMRCLPTWSSGSCQGFEEKWLRNRFCIFSPDNVHNSIFAQGETDSSHPLYVSSGVFGFSRLTNLSPSEIDFLAKTTTQEKWLFYVLQNDCPLKGEILLQQQSTEDGGNFLECSDEEPRSRAVRRLLMLPRRSESSFLLKERCTGLGSSPFEALVQPYKERFLHNVGLLRSVRKLMPAVQAPQIDVACADRGFTYRITEELQNPLITKLLVGYARISSYSGPALPCPPHHLIQDSCLELKLQECLLALPFRIFGSAPPVRSFDFARMLTDSGKLHVLDRLLKRLRAEDHRVLLFAQMTKMLNILEDYMNYRKYKYLRLDGSSTIMDRRDMVKDFQHRGDIFVFLLSTRAGGLGINLTAADTVIFYESDWNPTMDLQAMDRAHRLGQTKEVTVYRLTCKGTVEEKIMKRASQKNTVQQLVMTGGQSQGDVFDAEEVVSLLLDDAELEQRLKEQQHGSKPADRTEKRKKGWVGGSSKGVRLDAEGGGVSLDVDAIGGSVDGQPLDYRTGGQDGSLAGGGGGSGGSSEKHGIGKKFCSLFPISEGPGEGKVPKPPKAPKLPKEPKPVKEPKIRKERRQTKVPRPPRTTGLPRARGGRPGRPKRVDQAGGSVQSGALVITIENSTGCQYVDDLTANDESSVTVKPLGHINVGSTGDQRSLKSLRDDATTHENVTVNVASDLSRVYDFVKTEQVKSGDGREKLASGVCVGKTHYRSQKKTEVH